MIVTSDIGILWCLKQAFLPLRAILHHSRNKGARYPLDSISKLGFHSTSRIELALKESYKSNLLNFTARANSFLESISKWTM